MRNLSWFGVDVNNKESLFTYGFLMKWVPAEKEYKVVYLGGFDENNDPIYFYSRFDYEGWKQELCENMYKGSYPDANSVASCCGMDAADWLDTLQDRPEALLFDLLNYYDTIDIFGINYWGGYSESEIKKRLNKALN